MAPLVTKDEGTDAPQWLAAEVYDFLRSKKKIDVAKQDKKSLLAILDSEMKRISEKISTARRLKTRTKLMQDRTRMRTASTFARKDPDSLAHFQSGFQVVKTRTGREYTRSHHIWTSEQKFFVQRNLQKRDNVSLTREINKRFGTMFTSSSVQTMKYRLRKGSR